MPRDFQQKLKESKENAIKKLNRIKKGLSEVTAGPKKSGSSSLRSASEGVTAPVAVNGDHSLSDKHHQEELDAEVAKLSVAAERAIHEVENIHLKGESIQDGPPMGATAFVTDEDVPLNSLWPGSSPPPPRKKAWTNWAENQSCDPTEIFYPETLDQVKAIVLQAKAENKKVRFAASGHTWSSSSVTDGFLVNVNKMTRIQTPVYSDKEKSWTVTLETGVLVKDLDVLLRKHDPPLALPSNVVLDTVRYGGILSLGCHGAATHTRTLPDLITEVTILDAQGTLNSFTKEKNPEEFSAACVNLGLLGYIHEYTLLVEEANYRIKGTDTFVPLQDYFQSPEIGGPKLKEMVLRNDQTELFYWPFNTPGLGAANDKVWIKQWQRTQLPITVSPEQEAFQTILQNLETTFGDKLYEFMATHPECTPFVACLMFSIFKDQERVQEIEDAIHYQAGIDNIKCLDLEMAFKVNEDFSNVVRAWNYVIEQLYEHADRGEFPFNLTLEMRFVKASSMMLSNAYDDDPEAIYCMMEVLSVQGTKGFDAFSAKIAKFWMQEFKAKPHWAKQFEHVDGIIPYLCGQAGDRYDRFEVVRKKYDPEGMFMNATFAGLFGH